MPRPEYVVALALSLVGLSCRPGDILSVPPPVGVLRSATNAAGAESELTGAIGWLSGNVAGPNGLLPYSGLLTDEMIYAQFNEDPSLGLVATDARNGDVGTLAQYGGAVYGPLSSLLNVRPQFLIAEAALQYYEPASGHVGLAYALAGYTELLLAENFCAGVPLSTIVPGGGWQYAAPLTSDSLLGAAEAHFDSALKYAAGSDTTANLAAVGLGRTRLDRGNYTGAAQAVAAVPVGFVYGLVFANA
jgi:hypothetical protein